MLLQNVAARLKTIKDVVYVGGAIEFSALTEQNKRPQRTPALFVVPLRTLPGRKKERTGPVLQKIETRFAVISCLTDRSDDTGEKANVKLSALLTGVQKKLYGWVPPSDTEPFDEITLGPSGLLQFAEYTVWYQSEFITARFEEANPNG